MKESEQVIRIKFSFINFISLLAICVASYFLFRVSQIIISLFFSLIIMSAIRPIVFWMEKKLRFPRAVSILFVYAFLILLIALAIMVIVPPLVEELPIFIQTLSLPPLPSDLLELKATLSELSIYLPQIGSSFQTLATLVSSAFNGILTFVTILVMASYLLIDRERLHLKLSWFTKDAHYLNLAKKLIDQVEMQLGGWVRGQLSLMLIIGLITYSGLTLLGISYALPLALAAGLLEVLPNIGPLVAAVPAIATAYLVGGPTLTVFTVLFYILVQQFENNLIVPKIMKDNADVNPLTTIVLILIGFKLGNVIGALLAIPLYIVLRSIYSMWYKERHAVQA